MALRTLLAAVLGIGLGLFLLAAPETAVRMQTAGRLPNDRTGEYGTDARVPERWRRIVRFLGVVLIALGGYFALVALG